MKSTQFFLSLIFFLLCTVSNGFSSNIQYKQLPDARVGENYEYCVAVKGLIEPILFEWAFEEKPEGIIIDGPLISGIPKTKGLHEYTFKLLIKDALINHLNVIYKLRVRPALHPLKIVHKSIPIFIKGEPVEYEIPASGGEGIFQWKKCKKVNLPKGLTIFSDKTSQKCIISGTPTEIGETHIIVSVSDDLKNSIHEELKGRVVELPLPIEIISNSIPTANYKTLYFAQLRAIGGYPPYTWKIKSWKKNIAKWIALDNKTGTISGIPDTIGSYQIKVEVTDTNNKKAISQWLTLEVKPLPLQIKFYPKILNEAIIGFNYNQNIFIDNVQGHIYWDIEWKKQKPEWIDVKFNGPQLQIQGIPQKISDINFSIIATDYDSPLKKKDKNRKILNTTGPQQFNIVVKSLPLKLITEKIPSPVYNIPFEMALYATGGYPPYEWSLSSNENSNVPKWLKFDSQNGILYGTPDRVKKHILKINIIDSNGEHFSGDYFQFNVNALSSSLEFYPKHLPDAVIGKYYSEFIVVSGYIGYIRWDVKWLNHNKWIDYTIDGQLLKLSGTFYEKVQVGIEINVEETDQPESIVDNPFVLNQNSKQYFFNVKPE